MKTLCFVCKKREVDNYEPVLCCSGRDCGCRGMPVEPALCSLKCSRAIYGGEETLQEALENVQLAWKDLKQAFTEDPQFKKVISVIEKLLRKVS